MIFAVGVCQREKQNDRMRDLLPESPLGFRSILLQISFVSQAFLGLQSPGGSCRTQTEQRQADHARHLATHGFG